MERTESAEAESQQLIRMFRGKHIMLFRDFEAITGVRLIGRNGYTSHKRSFRLRPGTDFNGWGWKCDNEQFREEYGFDYGDDDCMMYLYPCGIRRALNIYSREGGKTDIIQTILDMMEAAGICRLNEERTMKGKAKSPTPWKPTLVLSRDVKTRAIMIGDGKAEIELKEESAKELFHALKAMYECEDPP